MKKTSRKRKGTKAAKFSCKKEAIVTKTFVEVGKPVVLKNDHVEKGQLLVSGIYGNEESPTIVSAKGIVYGETWYTSEVSVPLKTQFQVYTGNAYNEHYLTFGSVKIKIWGFQHDKYKRSRTESVKHDVKLFGLHCRSRMKKILYEKRKKRIENIQKNRQ